MEGEEPKKKGKKFKRFLAVILALIVAGLVLYFVFGGDDEYDDYDDDEDIELVDEDYDDDEEYDDEDYDEDYDDEDYDDEEGGSLIGGILSALVGGGSSSLSEAVQKTPQYNASYDSVNTSVASGVRAKRTKILGNGNDKVTILVYMCGSDLETKNSMATNDLLEMQKAKLGSNVNLIVYTGGTKKWQNKQISNSVNQIFQVSNGSLKKLKDETELKSMVKPSTLSSFIKWGTSNYPANRFALIFWDHGGGSVSGYGYDERFQDDGSMSLAGINTALKDGGVKFDFIGFDTCLMATAENALMLDEYADYMIASEETEPGIGWYYTNWLTKLGANTSMPTLDIGKNIIDDFISKCDSECHGEKTTLSMIDLAEFSYTVPKVLSEFSKSISKLVANKDYKSVSTARYSTREFSASDQIDQIDLIDLCNNMGTSEGEALAIALKNAIKYNKTSKNMTNAYGVSIYFPYQSADYVDEACEAYNKIGMNSDYASAIRAFASVEVTGQAASGGSSSPVASLLGLLTDSSTDFVSLLSSFFDDYDYDDEDYEEYDDYDDDRSVSRSSSGKSNKFIGESGFTKQDFIDFISEDFFDASNLKWKEYSNGKAVLSMDDDQWDLVCGIDKNIFVDDGEGYIDLGLDNIFDWTKKGDLLADTERTWLAIEEQFVAYYHEDSIEISEDETITTGYVPCLLNDEPAILWLTFDKENPDGYISEIEYDYDDEVTTSAKTVTKLKKGDKIEFVCDFYSYEGEYQDSYVMGEPVIVGNKPLKISEIEIADSDIKITYRFTDIYNQEYWTPSLDR